MTSTGAKIAEDRRALLAKLLGDRKARVLPASFAQRRLWLLDQIEPDSSHYNLVLAVELHGELNTDALDDAIKGLVERHEVLRTTFAVHNDEPVQVVHAESRVGIASEDLSGCDDNERERRARQLLASTSAQPFNLKTGPLFRPHLVRLQPDAHLLILTIHHIVTDGWSNGILLRELSELYRAAVSGGEAELPKLEIQYSDFASWQQNYLGQEVLSRQLGYWIGQLQHIEPLELPTDRPRPPKQTYNGRLTRRRLSPELIAEIREFCLSRGVSLYMTALACFNVLLQRYSSQDDIAIGSPIANRNRAEIENLIGFFVNTLVMRSDLSGDPDFLTLLQRIKETTLAAFEHQDVPFERLVEELKPERDRSRSPLFQVMFAVQNTPAREFELTGLSFRVPHLEIQTVRFDLEAYLWEKSEELTLGFVYNTDLFDAGTIDRMLLQLQRLLIAAVRNPAQKISQMALLGDSERQQLLNDWNQTSSPYPRESTVASLFEEQVLQQPGSVALEFGDTCLSYAELNERANRLAHYLRARSIGAESRVGLFVERDADMVVGVLGILKAGGAYVPLDLEYPASRIAFMLEDAGVPLLLSQSGLIDRLPEFAGDVICLDRDWPAIAQHGADNPEPVGHADDLAYVIYTSGSTGTPKGVEIQQRAINRLVRETDYYQVGPTDRIAQASTISFDAATFELWGALLNGACLVGIDKQTFLSPQTLSVCLREKQISAMFVTTAVFNQVARELPSAFSGLECLMFGGEAVDTGAVRAVLAQQPPRRLLHVYGPTESTTFASWYEVESVAEAAATVPVGRPLANTTLYVLDKHRQPVPVGVPGELYIGGDGLARGYLKRPELTAERFVAHPFAAGERLYRSGDKVRFRADGAIEFLGRFDHQIKLRGFRIELGEIETALINNEALQDAVVVVREDEPGDRRIVAYVLAKPAWVKRLTTTYSGSHVDEWQALYEETYGNVDATQDLTMNFAGWNSSYTGAPIPLAEMNEWLESTLDRIRVLEPRRVLEIGCGTGLLLYRLAPECERYVGTDFSEVAQRQLRQVIASSESHRQVELWQRTADDFSDIGPGDFDTVVINSVAQYLPSMEYLVALIESSVASIADGGCVMLGDIRSLPLLQAYHASVQMHLSTDTGDGSELLRNIRQHVEEENELVIEPAFFHALEQRIERISHVEILLKRGRHHNELSCYRYDVLLHVSVQAEQLPDTGTWLDWGASGLSMTTLRARLAESDRTWLGVGAIPNARVARDVEILEILQGESGVRSLGELRLQVNALQSNWIEPDDMWVLARETGFELELSFTGAGTDGRMDALFRRKLRKNCAGHVYWPQQQPVATRPWGVYGSNPLKGRLANELIPRLRDDLQRHLPEYMMPAVYVVMDAFPLNPNGKVERKALPVPGDVRASLGTEYTAPRSEVERQLAVIWAEVLKLERVGIHDNFFDLGGHSLMATQVVSRIRGRLQVELPLAEMFGYPTVAELAPTLAALLSKADVEPATRIYRVDRAHHLPLSFAQERLWFLDQLEPGSNAYNMSLALRLQGEVDVAALTATLDTILQRHEVLRTHFAFFRQQPHQVIEANGAKLAQDDLSALPVESRADALQAQIRAEAERLFDLARGPLLRSRLLRLADREHVLLLTMHHIVSDGWSLGLLFQELGTAYAALSRGDQPQLKPLSIQYADFAAWQREWLTGEVLQSQLAYWREQLSALETLEMPTDRPRPATQTYNGAALELDLTRDLVVELDRYAQHRGVSLFMACLTAFAVLMHRYSGQDDVVVGTPIANRNRAEVEDLIGFFVNNLVMRTDVSGNPDFNQLLGRVQQTALAAYEHQDLPFEKLVDEIQPERDRSRNPLFQVAFALQNAPFEPLQLSGLRLEMIPRKIQRARFDIECHLWQRRQNLTINLVYNTDLFDEWSMNRLLSHYRRLLEAMVASPDARVDDILLLDEHENWQILHDWNRTQTDYPRDATVVSLFEEQVQLHPQSVALEFADTRLSYVELNERANRLAHYLRARGIGPEVRVGLFMERDADMVEAVLGIVKAGGAYVPLDLEYPASRIAFMLEDAGVPLLLSQSGLLDRIPEFAGEVVCLDRDWPTIEQQSADNPAPVTNAQSLAYVIYTSGSTGTPKGVEIRHRAINRLVRDTDYYQVESTDRIAQASTISFDAATFELWGALLNGARLVGIDKQTFLSPQTLSACLREKRISAMFVTTAVFNQVARELPSAFSGLRCLMFGGEAVDTDAVRAVLSKRPPERLLHVYGPTESTTFASWYEIDSVAETATTVPIGRPLANTTLYVLDRHHQPVPVGVPGELYIGGDGLARGYLKRPELTAERFVAHPFAAGERLYRTGDKVRYREDGAIEFLGRFDHQVKLRGFRIELGEIETALNRHPGIDSSVVMLREDEPGDKRLVAYLVASESGVPEGPELRSLLRESLPDYMLPAAFVTLESLPLNANGKVDRDALPLPGDKPGDPDAEYAAPRGELEMDLARIWAEVLKLERVGIHKNFFDLGGHSLMATQIVSRIREQFDVEVPLAEIFANPTLAELAPVVDSLRQDLDTEPDFPIPVANRDADLLLSFAQERLWFLEQLEPGEAAYNMPLVLRLQGTLDVQALSESLNEVVSRQEALRTRFVMNRDQQPVQIIQHEGTRLHQEDLSALPPDARDTEVRALIDDEALKPFDLGTGPLLRCRLLRLSPQDHMLLLTMHHIIADGWSLGVLFKELTGCYAAFIENEKPKLAELPIQYADFAAWQRQWLSGERLASQAAYWEENLKNLPTLDLPSDRPRPPVKTFDGDSQILTLDSETSNRLEALSHQRGATLYMTLLAAFALLMQRYSAQDDIAIGSAIANRNRREVEALVGFFVNMLVMRIDLSGDPDFGTLLKRVQKTALGAYQNQDIPFEKLVEVLQPDRDRSRNPLFQVQFALQNAPVEPLQLKGLTLSPASGTPRTTRFDLECHVWPRDDGLRIVLVYNTSLFDAATIKSLLGHYRTLLEGIVVDPGRRISDIPMLEKPEFRQLVETWNQTASSYPRDKTVHELFEIQAAEAPQAIALEYEGATLSYDELNVRANQLAHYLQARGVGPEVKVGLMMARGTDLIIATLGILKAGGAYVPLDLEYPASRIAFMLEDAEVPLLLSQSGLIDRLPEFTGEVLCLDRDWPTIEKQSGDNPESGGQADDLAYVIYTSGSTGTPKGVEIQHRAINRLVRETDYYQVGVKDRIAQVSTISFDAATFELWGALLNGACLVGIDKQTFLSPQKLSSCLREKQISAMFVTTAVFNQVARELPSAFAALECLMFGGEAVDTGAVRAVLSGHPPKRLLHVYGPTESTTFASWYEIDSVAETATTVPIGRPLANTTLYVLDRHRQPVPVGVPGELYIGGDGLARGYLKRPELTAERFVAHPFAAGERLYRTGDKVRYREDGAIEFLGRFDHQIKLRGFRIELGEIETALNRHPGIDSSVVMLREDEPGDKRLVAYLVASESGVPQGPELRSLLRESLPDYMLPAAFVTLESLPLNANGKVDRDALPLPGERGEFDTQYTAPRNDLEKDLARIWEEVLKLERVGIHDNFFDLGGHSLLATRIVSLIREQLNAEIPLSSMFDFPTIAELAALEIFTAATGNTEQAPDTIEPSLRSRTDLAVAGENLPLSFAQERLWYIHALYPDIGAAYNVSFVVRLETGIDRLDTILQTLQLRHSILRTTYTLQRSRPVQRINPDPELCLQVFDVADFSEDELRRAVLDFNNRPINLETGPIWRCAIVKQGDRTRTLAITVHHIAFDGWSLNLLKREILKLADLHDIESGLAETGPGLQYIDYALWQREQSKTPRFEKLQDFWARQLNGIPAEINLPLDKKRSPVFSHSGASEIVALSPALSDRLRRFASDNEVTLFILMLAVFKLLLSRYAQQSDIVVGTAESGRARPEMHDIVGLFVNSVVLRSDLSVSQTFAELLKKVRQSTLEAFEHRDLPFEKVVDVIQPERDLSRNPLFQVMFTFNVPDEVAQTSVTQKNVFTSEEIVSGYLSSSQVDLTLSVNADEKQLVLSFDYNDDLFEKDTIHRMMVHYRRLLDDSISAPSTPIEHLSMLSEEEKRLIVHQWNQTGSDYIKNETLHSLFQQQVDRAPRAEAVRFGQQGLDYSELCRKVDEMTFFLLDRKVQPGQLVGVCIERSIDLVVAILGILKAGAAYVPLDPANPVERIEYILRDSNTGILLSQRQFENRLPSAGLEKYFVDDHDLLAKAKPRPLPTVSPEMPAYVIYTSGSTGKPKGVMVTHAAVVNHACWMREYFAVGPGDRMLLKSPINFDASVSELMDPLVNGACVVVASIGADMDSARQVREIRQQGVTIVILVPSALRMMLSALKDPADLSTLRFVGCGGEELTPELLRDYYRKCKTPLYNLYGPTETTIDATCFLCPPDFDGDRVPIGTPVGNARAYILDRRLQPVPIGATGELHIGGAGLARGYLNRPELTAEKFIADPYCDEPGQRMYKSGDLARYRADGNIVYVGRLDHQVKLRGFRIEPGEVESALLSHDAVQEALVIVREDRPGDQRLVAYLVANGAEPDGSLVTKLRSYLRTRLPDYMIPAALVMLDHFPLTVNGKLDRQALPIPEGERQLDGAYVEPRSDLEEKLVDIWRDVLDVKQVGIHDNFFDLGGHSIKLVELQQKLNDELDSPLSLMDLFEHPSVSALVEHVTSTGVEDNAAIRASEREANLAAGNRRLLKLRQSRQQGQKAGK